MILKFAKIQMRNSKNYFNTYYIATKKTCRWACLVAIPILEKQQKSEYRRASCIFFQHGESPCKKNNYGPDHLQSALIIDLMAKNDPRHTLDLVF